MTPIGIAKSSGKAVLLKRGGNTDDIVEAILDTIGDVRSQTREFAEGFSPDEGGLYRLWRWVRTNIHYNEDPLGVQWIREPARLWEDREGDCKSFTVFIVSVLENIGLDYFVRFTNTERRGSKIVNHVYPVAILPGGRQIILDAVYRYFNREHPYYLAKDYSMAEIYRLSGIGDPAENAAAYLQNLEAVFADIPDDVLDDDLTTKSRGEIARRFQAEEFDALAAVSPDATRIRYQAAASAVRAGSIAGIGNLNPSDARRIDRFLDKTNGMTEKAFTAPVLVLPEGISGDGLLKDFSEAVKKAWKKLVNWIFKTAMPGASPFFLYTFSKKSLPGNTGRRQVKQMGAFYWMKSNGRFESLDDLRQVARTGIIKKTGKTPEAVLNGYAAGIAGADSIGWIAAALGFVIDIINKIVALFKGKKAEISASDQPDLAELQLDLSQPSQSITPTNSTSSTASGNSNTALLVGGAALLGAAFLLNR